jgi:hypothetical protein
MKKIKIGIDIDEILRAKWIQFDRYYVEEFGEEGIPKDMEPYTHDYFRDYGWKDTIERKKYLKEPEKTPDTINPLDYQVDKNNEAMADSALFMLEEKTELKAKEVYNKFMYEDYVLEIHGTAPVMYKGMELHIDKFLNKYKDFADFIIISKENWFSIPPTLFFLSKMMSRFKEYRFVEDYEEYWGDDIDLLITANPDVLLKRPTNKKFIKPSRPYNKILYEGEVKDILQLNDLTDNEEFEKLINYKQKI